jgi:uncharacterized OB-fold protein
MSNEQSRTDLGAPFWEGVARRKLMLQFDPQSQRFQFYPRPQSLYGEAPLEWRESGGKGTILALTLSRVAPPELADKVPYPLALVRLDEGPRLLARVVAPYESLAIGDAVEVSWEEGGAVPSFPVFTPRRQR